MFHSLIGIVFATIANGNADASDSVPLPKDVPPVIGVAVAVVKDAGEDDRRGEWKIRLTIPKITWEVVGKSIPKKQWPELSAQVEKTTLFLRMGGPSALSPSRIVNVKGKDLNYNQVVKRLEKETPVLISVSGRMPDAYFLQLTTSDALIVILGPRDGGPAPDLLPSEKGASKKRNTGSDK